MLTKFLNHIKQHFPFLMESPFFIAVSGGIDSMVLVHLLENIKTSFTILHCNFQLRGEESDADMEFVETYARQHQIPHSIVKFDTKKYAKDRKRSTQVAARELRYNWFSEQLATKEGAYLLTAHHLDDSLETFMINLSRGTGLDGLTGIPTTNGAIIRPLLIFSRAEIEAYAVENNISWREDLSNYADDYVRNKFRHHLIPTLKELNPNFLNAFEITINHLQQSQSMVNDAANLVFLQVGKAVRDEYHFDIEQMKRLSNRNAYLYHWLKSFGFTAWNDIYNLITAQSGKQVFSATHVLLKDRNHLILSVKKNPDDERFLIERNSGHVNFPLKFTFKNVSAISETDSNCIFVDEAQLHFPLVLRKWEEADFFHPFGMTGKKKLSKYFKDEKLPLTEKSTVWLLCSDNRIVWVVGKRQDERFKVTKNTTKILQICIPT